MSRDMVPAEYGEYEIGPLFVKALNDEGFTQFNVFSFYLDGPGEVSFIDFNGFMQNHIKNADDTQISWLKLKDDFYWASYCEGLSFGKPSQLDTVEESPNAFGFDGGISIFTIFDTGTSFTLMPPSFWVVITETIILASGLEAGSF
jgi:hypothetical protein